MFSARINLSALAAVSLFFVAALPAQTPPSITGSVVDSKGSLVAHAKIAVHSADNKITRSAIADDSGHFALRNVPSGEYVLDADAPGFATTHEAGVTVANDKPANLTVTLRIGNLEQMVEVQADASNSVAAQEAPMDARLDARSARTEITPHFIENYTTPTADNTEMIFFAPGTFSVNPNGSGLGDSKSFFRGFSDGNYDITFDGIPYEDTNSPTHHSWAFFPAPFIGSIDFDRSPGSASTVGPTPFGGSINMLSKTLRQDPDIIGSVSYGSFNTILTDVQINSGALGANNKTHFLADFNHLTSDGFQSWNAQERSAGDIKVEYRFNDEKILTGYSGVGLLDTNTPNTKGPTRAQYLLQYNYLLQRSDPTRSDFADYNYYHIPSDFEYVGFIMPLGHGWHLDTKQYTYSYYNQQNYAATPKTGIVSATNCLPEGTQNCGTDKLNSYRKYGDITTASQVSKYGIFRTGLWYEWATTSRHQIPQDPITHADTVVPNFNEMFITNSYQPFAEYEWHPSLKLTVTGGAKFSRYTFDLKQLSDNGGAVGTLPAGQTAVYHYATFNTILPSADVNYRFRENWSAYAQFGTGSLIPRPASSTYPTSSAVCSSIQSPSFRSRPRPTPTRQAPSSSFAASPSTATSTMYSSATATPPRQTPTLQALTSIRALGTPRPRALKAKPTFPSRTACSSISMAPSARLVTPARPSLPAPRRETRTTSTPTTATGRPARQQTPRPGASPTPRMASTSAGSPSASVPCGTTTRPPSSSTTPTAPSLAAPASLQTRSFPSTRSRCPIFS